MDASTFRWINRFAVRTGWAHPLFVGFATYGIVVFAVLLVVAYLDGRRRDDLHAVAATVWADAAAVVALGIAQLVGGSVDRARPYDAMPGVHVLISRSADFSFPSDHATAAGAVAAGLLFAGRRRWGVIAVACAIVMGLARVYVGVHYPGDVLAGLALGAAVAMVGQFFVVPLLRRLGERLTATPLRPLVTAQPSHANPDHRIDVRLGAQATLRSAWRTLHAVWCALWSRWRALSARAATDRTRALRVGAVAVAGLLVAVPFGLCAVEVVTHGPLTALDQRVVERVNGYNVGDRDDVDVARIVSALGSTVFLGLVLISLVVIVGIKQHRRAPAVYLALTGVVGFALDQGLKTAIGRSRPVLDHTAAHALGHSFPSGHAMNSTVVYGALLIVAWPRL